MSEKKKAAMELLSGYKITVEQKKIIDEQMFSIAELYRGLIREEKSYLNEDSDLYNAYKEKLALELARLQARKGALFLRQRLINCILDRLPLEEKTVLKRFYINGDSKGAADELMEVLSFEKTHIYRLRDRGLERVGLLMEAFPDLDILDGGTGEEA